MTALVDCEESQAVGKALRGRWLINVAPKDNNGVINLMRHAAKIDRRRIKALATAFNRKPNRDTWESLRDYINSLSQAKIYAKALKEDPAYYFANYANQYLREGLKIETNREHTHGWCPAFRAIGGMRANKEKD